MRWQVCGLPDDAAVSRKYMNIREREVGTSRFQVKVTRTRKLKHYLSKEGITFHLRILLIAVASVEVSTYAMRSES